jgi:hypothetical protein
MTMRYKEFENLMLKYKDNNESVILKFALGIYPIANFILLTILILRGA